MKKIITFKQENESRNVDFKEYDIKDGRFMNEHMYFEHMKSKFCQSEFSTTLLISETSSLDLIIAGYDFSKKELKGFKDTVFSLKYLEVNGVYALYARTGQFLPQEFLFNPNNDYDTRRLFLNLLEREEFKINLYVIDTKDSQIKHSRTIKLKNQSKRIFEEITLNMIDVDKNHFEAVGRWLISNTVVENNYYSAKPII